MPSAIRACSLSQSQPQITAEVQVSTPAGPTNSMNGAVVLGIRGAQGDTCARSGGPRDRQRRTFPTSASPAGPGDGPAACAWEWSRPTKKNPADDFHAGGVNEATGRAGLTGGARTARTPGEFHLGDGGLTARWPAGCTPGMNFPGNCALRHFCRTGGGGMAPPCRRGARSSPSVAGRRKNRRPGGSGAPVIRRVHPCALKS
jgi:hypothetical protein